MFIVSAHMIFSAVAALLYGILAWRVQTLTPTGARRMLWAVVACHAIGLLSGLFVPPPAFGFAHATSAAFWLVLLVYVFESNWQPKLRAQGILAVLGMVAVLLPLFFPGRALPAQQTVWMSIHVVLGMAAYALLGCAVLHAWLMGRAEAALRKPGSRSLLTGGLPVLSLERLMLGFVQVGFGVLTATLVAGMFFSEYLHGQVVAFAWTHKLVFAWLSWLALGVLVLGRWRLGWRGRKAAHMVYIGAAFLLLSYIGSHFVTEVLLHRSVS